MKTTEWYPGSIKPEHIGWYETNLGFLYWTGFRWKIGPGYAYSGIAFGFPFDKWRGLKERA